MEFSEIIEAINKLSQHDWFDYCTLLLRNRLDYIEKEYNKLILTESLKGVLINILKVRNKFTHEPHNLSVGLSVILI